MQQNLPSFIHALAPIVNQYGYLAVGGFILLEDFGIPVPGETVLITSAIFSVIGHLNIFLVILIATIGAIIGDNIGFAIGDFGGRKLIEKYGKYIFITPTKLTKLENFFNKRGGVIVIVARFIEGLRQANGIIAGISEMSWLRFVVYNSIGAILWVNTWALIGYFAADHINTLLKYQTYFTFIIIIGLILFILYKVINHWRRQNQTLQDK